MSRKSHSISRKHRATLDSYGFDTRKVSRRVRRERNLAMRENRETRLK